MDEYQYQQKHSEEGEMYEYLQQWMDEYQYQYQQKHSEEVGMYEYLQQKKKQQQQKQKQPQQQKQQKQKQVNEYPDDHHVLKDIPELIIFNILIRIPADLLFNKFRSVCKNWLGIISSPLFVEQLPNYSKPSLLLQFPPKPHSRSKIRPTLIRIKDEGGGDETEVEILNKKTNNHLCAMGGIRGSCNGLLLTHDTSSYPKLKMIVSNPTTRCMHTLPKCLSGCPHKTCSFALAFDSSTDTFKVVHMYADQFGFEIYNLGTAAAAAATNTGSDDVQHSRKGSKKKKKNRNDDGTNSWRKVPGPFEYVYERPFNVETFCWSDATMVNSRFLHWKVDSKDYIISMNVSDERSRKTPLPHNHEAYSNLERLDYSLVEMGGYLALMFGVQQEHDLDDDDDDEHIIIIDQLDFWILKDFEEGIWMKRLSISMECINFVKCQPQLDMLRPRGCLEDGEVIVFERVSSGSSSASSGFYVYDVKSSSMKKVTMKMKLGEYKVVAYRSCFTSWTKESIKEGNGNR